MDQIQKPKSQAVAVPTDNRQLTTAHFLAWIAWSIALAVLILRHAAGGVDRVYAFNDYMLAGSHWLRGEYLYGNWRGFIYSPGIAAFFVPLALLPSVISYGLWLLLNVAVFLGGAGVRLTRKHLPGAGS